MKIRKEYSEPDEVLPVITSISFKDDMEKIRKLISKSYIIHKDNKEPLAFPTMDGARILKPTR